MGNDNTDFSADTSVTKFFQTKITPPALWNSCDYVLQFKFRIMHVASSQNTAADFLSRLELTPKKSSIEATRRYTNSVNRSQSPIERRRRRRAIFLPTKRGRRIGTRSFCKISTQQTTCYRRT